MSLKMHRVQVWSGEVSDRPGAAAALLALLAHAGTDLEFIFTRPIPGKTEVSRIFLAPVQGPEQIEAAKRADLAPALDVAMLCVEGENRQGIGYEIMSRLAVSGVCVRGLSISSVAQRFAAYIAFDNADTASMAVRILATID